MKRLYHKSLFISAIAAVALTGCGGGHDDSADVKTDTSTRRERNLVKEANKDYENKEYAKAEVANRKALAENPSSDVARFNLASSLSHMEDEKAKTESDSIFTSLAEHSINPEASQRSYYNLGNEAYRGEQYEQSIEMYKDALRRDPSDDNARQNLRLAQLKLQEQQNQQDQNQDQDQDQQDQQQEQQEQQQQEQNQQDQNNENEDQQNQNQDQNQQDQQQGNKRPDEQNQQDRQDQQQGGISQSNAEQILKAMEDEEKATRRRVEAQMKADKERKSTRRNVEKPW